MCRCGNFLWFEWIKVQRFQARLTAKSLDSVVKLSCGQEAKKEEVHGNQSREVYGAHGDRPASVHATRREPQTPAEAKA